MELRADLQDAPVAVDGATALPQARVEIGCSPLLARVRAGAPDLGRLAGLFEAHVALRLAVREARAAEALRGLLQVPLAKVEFRGLALGLDVLQVAEALVHGQLLELVRTKHHALHLLVRLGLDQALQGVPEVLQLEVEGTRPPEGPHQGVALRGLGPELRAQGLVGRRRLREAAAVLQAQGAQRLVSGRAEEVSGLGVERLRRGLRLVVGLLGPQRDQVRVAGEDHSLVLRFLECHFSLVEEVPFHEAVPHVPPGRRAP
eukprot:11933347-Heterocapsa_arctica.AAC.1